MDIETVTIHHPELHAEAQVPPETVDSWGAQGWIPGPFPTADNRPPKTGKGSGFAAWLDYATKRDIILDVGATREDIIAAVEQVDAQPIASSQPGSSENSPVGEIPHGPEEDQS